MRLRFFTAEALRSIRSNAAVSVAATVTVFIAVFILGIFIATFLRVQSEVQTQKDRLDINIYLAQSATVEQVNSIKTQLAALQSGGEIKAFTYVSPEEGLAELRERLTDPTILENLPSNPLPAKFNVKPTDPTRSSAIADEFRGGPAIDAKYGVQYGKKIQDKFLTAAQYIQWAGLGLITVLLVASILLIGNTIRLSIFARRREVEVMKLVGATNWFIRWPFVIEGIFCGLVGAVLAVVSLWAIKVAVVDTILTRDQDTLTRVDSAAIAFPLLGLLLVASGAVVGALGSGITLRRFLKV